jgi:hypothetical protein
VSPQSKKNRLNALPQAAAAAAKLQDKGNRVFRDSSETSFRKVADLWKLNLDYTKRKVFDSGRHRANDMLKELYNQVFVTNLHTCLYDSQTGMVANISPPSVEDYLRNINLGLVVDCRK